MTWRGLVVALIAGNVALLSGAAWSEAARREGGGDIARLQTMLQQLNTEKTNLSADNSKLKAELDKTKRALDDALKERDSGTQKLGRSAQDLVNALAKSDSLQRAFDTLKGRFDQLVEQFRATVATMRDVEQDRDRLVSNVADDEVRVKECERANEALYKSTLELIGLYERKGVFTSLMQREPVTGIKRVEIENLMDEYRQLAEDQRLNVVSPNEAAAAAQADDATGQNVTKASQ